MTGRQWLHFAGITGLMVTGSAIGTAPAWFIILLGMASLAMVIGTGDCLADRTEPRR